MEKPSGNDMTENLRHLSLIPQYTSLVVKDIASLVLTYYQK